MNLLGKKKLAQNLIEDTIQKKDYTKRLQKRRKNF